MDLAILMLILLNPFSQTLYLKDLMDSMTSREFARAHFHGSLLSFLVFVLFVLVGEPLLSEVFRVHLGSLRIFGGLIILYIAYRYLTVGSGSSLIVNGSGKPIDPATLIALPYTIGPGSLWVAILMGTRYPYWQGLSLIAGVLAINFVCLVLAKFLFDHLEGRRETLASRYFQVLMRTSALLIGGVGIEMIVSGLAELGLAPQLPPL